jgi:hypothetical protein
MATWIGDIVTALSNLGGAAPYDDIYAEIKRIRGNSLPTSWQNIIQREIQAHASESLTAKKLLVAAIRRGQETS